MLASVEGPVHASAYDYEDNRDLMITVDNRATDLNGSSLSDYGYTYDALGRRGDRTQSGSKVNTPSTDDFSYNPRSEVIGSSNDTETAAAWNPTFDYDKVGNRLSSTGGTSSASSVTYETNALNQYTQVSGLSSQPSYDLDGNLTSDGGNWTYTWNNENRLSSATDGTVTIDFTYDYQGRLVKKDDGTDVEVYVYDGWNRIATFDLQTSNLTLQTSYLWGLDLSGSMQGAGGVGGLLKEGDFYPAYDANGNIMQKLDGTGAAVMSVDYDPFGNIIDGQLVGEYGFSTKPVIDQLDWYYYGFRYYDPVTGRWPSRDPIEEEGGLNLYVFVWNEPISHLDIVGLRSYSFEVNSPQTPIGLSAFARIEVTDERPEFIEASVFGAAEWQPPGLRWIRRPLGWINVHIEAGIRGGLKGKIKWSCQDGLDETKVCGRFEVFARAEYRRSGVRGGNGRFTRSRFGAGADGGVDICVDFCSGEVTADGAINWYAYAHFGNKWFNRTYNAGSFWSGSVTLFQSQNLALLSEYCGN